MIKFKYNVKSSLVPLIQNTIVNVDDPSHLMGIVDESRINSLKHTSLYLVCKMDDLNTSMIYSNPIAVVAKNQTEAIDMYYKVTKYDGASVLSELESSCDNLSVESI